MNDSKQVYICFRWNGTLSCANIPCKQINYLNATKSIFSIKFIKPSESAFTRSPTRGIKTRPLASTIRMALLSATNNTISYIMPNQSVIFFRCPRLLESSHTVIAIVQLLWLLTKIQQIWLLENFTYATQPPNMWMISLFLLQPLQCNNMFNVTNILNQYHRNHKRSYIKRAF